MQFATVMPPSLVYSGGIQIKAGAKIKCSPCPRAIGSQELIFLGALPTESIQPTLLPLRTNKDTQETAGEDMGNIPF